MSKVNHSNVDRWMKSWQQRRCFVFTSSAKKCGNSWRRSCGQIILRGRRNRWTVSAATGAVHDEQWTWVEPKCALFWQHRQQLPQSFNDRGNKFRAVSVSVKEKLSQCVTYSVDVKPSSVVLIVTDVLASVCTEHLHRNNPSDTSMLSLHQCLPDKIIHAQSVCLPDS